MIDKRTHGHTHARTRAHMHARAHTHTYAPYVGTADGKSIEILRLLVLERHLDGFEMRVHGDVDARDRAVDLRPILQLDGNSLVTQFHQKPNQLHREAGPLVSTILNNSLNK